MLKASLRSHLTLWFTGLSLLTLLIVAQTICSAIAQAAFAVVGHVTVSVGITLARASDANPAALINRADQQLYQAKRLGRNRVASFEQSS